MDVEGACRETPTRGPWQIQRHLTKCVELLIGWEKKKRKGAERTPQISAWRRGHPGSRTRFVALVLKRRLAGVDGSARWGVDTVGFA